MRPGPPSVASSHASRRSSRSKMSGAPVPGNANEVMKQRQRGEGPSYKRSTCSNATSAASDATARPGTTIGPLPSYHSGAPPKASIASSAASASASAPSKGKNAQIKSKSRASSAAGEPMVQPNNALVTILVPTTQLVVDAVQPFEPGSSAAPKRFPRQCEPGLLVGTWPAGK